MKAICKRCLSTYFEPAGKSGCGFCVNSMVTRRGDRYESFVRVTPSELTAEGMAPLSMVEAKARLEKDQAHKKA